MLQKTKLTNLKTDHAVRKKKTFLNTYQNSCSKTTFGFFQYIYIRWTTCFTKYTNM